MTNIEPLKTKTIGRNFADRFMAVSNDCYQNLRIVYTQNNWKKMGRIVV